MAAWNRHEEIFILVCDFAIMAISSIAPIPGFGPEKEVFLLQLAE